MVRTQTGQHDTCPTSFYLITVNSSRTLESVLAVKACRSPCDLRPLLKVACADVLKAYASGRKTNTNAVYALVLRGGLFFLPALLEEARPNPILLIQGNRNKSRLIEPVPKKVIVGRHIILLDVVADTGDTLRSCALHVRGRGAAELSAVVLFGCVDTQSMILSQNLWKDVFIADRNNSRTNGMVLPDAAFDVGDALIAGADLAD
jgi:phosphoribosylpyrophosphate synthetase